RPPAGQEAWRGLGPGRPGHASAGRGARAAHVEALDRPAVPAISQHRPGRPELVEAHIPVHDVAADQPEFAFEPLWAEPSLADDTGAKARRVFFDRVEDGIGGRLFFIVPVAAIGQLGRELLAEEAR